MDQNTVQSIVGRERYTVQRLLGRGGMSTVWLADDLRHNRLVAIKMLNRELGNNPEFRQRFRNEASAAQSVNSPNVVQIYNYQEGSAGNQDACYIVMEYIRGESLSQVLHRRASLPEHLALDVLEQTAHGLSAIHAANLVHRDIKPGNLLVTPEGTVKITDFGIAKAAEAVPLTRTGMVVGTAQYVSPEQAQGKHVNPATDIYSLGCVAYEMIAGKRPFTGDTTVAVAVAHINQPPPALAPTVNPHIRELIGIMLRKDPMRRYADGRELAKAVLQVRGGHRPPQPRGVQPTVYKQSNAAHPATSELGAMTRPGHEERYQQARSQKPRGQQPSAQQRRTQQGQVPANTVQRPRSVQSSVARPASKQTRERNFAKSSAGCGWMLLMVLLVLLVGAVAVVYSLINNGSIPGIPGFSGTSSESSVIQSWSSDNNEVDPNNGYTDATTSTSETDDSVSTTTSTETSDSSGTESGDSGSGGTEPGNTDNGTTNNGDNGGGEGTTSGGSDSRPPLSELADILSGGNS